MGLNRHRDVDADTRRAGFDRLDRWALAAVTLLGGALRFLRLGDPRALVFDETYYAKDGCWYATGSTSLCGIEGEQTHVHPPLGKWLISLGVEAFGYDSFGWRVAAALAGSLTVAVLYLLARRILRSTLGATVAAGLLAVDFLHFVQSRVAMLDVFTTLFGIAAVLFVALDRERLLSPEPPAATSWLTRLKQRPWRWATGAAAGAAVASKWSGVLFLLAVLALTCAWEVSARRGSGRRWARVLREEGPSIALCLAVVPLGVYALAYVGRLDGTLVAAPWSEGAWLRSLWERQLFMLDFHRGLDASHPYQSPPWSWPLLKRPVSYFFETNANGDYREILALGNPLVWWTSLLALLYVFVRWIPRRDMSAPEGLILAGFGFNYLPWLLLAGGRSAVFLFYLVAAVPFMCLALAYIPARFEDLTWMGASTVVFGALVLALFSFYYPLLANVPLPRADWEARIWVFDECDRPPPAASAGATAGTSGDTEGDGDDRPPEGWCWI